MNLIGLACKYPLALKESTLYHTHTIHILDGDIKDAHQETGT